MKKSILIGLLFVFACHSNNDKTIAFLNEGIENSNENITEFNDILYSYAECYILENPEKAKPYKTNVDSIKVKTANLLLAIENRKAEISPIGRPNNEKISIPSLKSIEKPKEPDLFFALSEYKISVNEIFPNDSVIIQSIEVKLNITESELKTYSISELNLLANKIQNLTNQMLFILTMKMANPRFRGNKLLAIAIPKEKYLYYNNLYEASLYLIACDTTANIEIVLENKNLELENGKALYLDTNTNAVGIITKNGNLKFKEYNYDVFYNYPFTIRYQIKDRK